VDPERPAAILQLRAQICQRLRGLRFADHRFSLAISACAAQMKIFTQGLLHDLALPSACHPAGLGERIPYLGG
jgi:hypothetical protein